jgi:hypothetical protein
VEQQRVAVGRRVHHLLRGDVAAGAGLVLDDHRLADRGLHLLGDQAGHDVGGAAGREGDDDANGLVWEGRQAGQRPCKSGKKDQCETRHGKSPSCRID